MEYINEFWKTHRMLKNVQDLSAEEKIILRRELAELANLAIIKLEINQDDKYFNFFKKIAENIYDKNEMKNWTKFNSGVYKIVATSLDKKLEKELIKELKKKVFLKQKLLKQLIYKN